LVATLSPPASIVHNYAPPPIPGGGFALRIRGHAGVPKIRIPSASYYLSGMPKPIEFCLPTAKPFAPAGADWIHEVKHDGYRLRAERSGDRVRLISRNGHDFTDRYPWIVEAARRIKHSQFIIDGEAVVLGVDGLSDFDALHSRRHDDDVQLYAFDVLALDDDDLRGLPLSIRKANLAELLHRRPQGIFPATFERGELGPDLFKAACRMGLEGLVSKHAGRAYRAGRADHWIKVKNRQHPAFKRVADKF
jgi:bifunctional non-homologous end joining protein LigD